ncbi:hypothetical protein NQ318_006642 [Aromia moschata]|uniref:Maturase K n=1 Tax=Aromia moschata TaxID=1265417 RepID=A0AAV8X8K3_9CUCU|nr:hypothetical protein NQ318_006642 [Aromia moschata]
MNEMTQSVNRLFQHISNSCNRELLYDLYSYIWDIRGVISLLNSYIKWLARGDQRQKGDQGVCASVTFLFFSPYWRNILSKSNDLEFSFLSIFIIQKKCINR